MAKIEVSYDGAYPNMCSGTLKVIVDGVTVYEDKYCCRSTGGVWIGEGESGVNDGELLFDDKDAMNKPWYTEEVAEAIRWELSKFPVCCGGCI